MKKCWEGEFYDENVILREKMKLELGIDNVGKILKDVLNVDDELEGLDDKYVPLFKGDNILNDLVHGDIVKSKRGGKR